MNKKKILIIIPGFKHGGTNRSLHNLLSIVDINKYEVHIFSMSHNGFYKDLFKKSMLLKESFYISAIMSNYREEFFFKKLLFVGFKIIVKLLSFLNVDLKNIIYTNISKQVKFQNYHTIIAFQEGESTLFSSKIICENKIAWIHCNYAEYLKYLNKKPEKELYKNFNSIVCVSNYTKDVFSDLIPELTDRVISIHNTLDIANVKRSALSFDLSNIFKKSTFNIISVGRVDVFKRFSLIPEIIFKLKNEGLIFKWFLIGGVSHPEEVATLLKNIEKYNVQDYINYLGEVDNPYPYIANSDLLVNTSLSEAFPYVLIEAKALGVPILVTNFGSAEECIIQGVEGIITPIEKMSDELGKLITDKILYESLKANLLKFEYDNDLILNKLYKIL